MKPKAFIPCVIALILIVLAGRAFAQQSCYPHNATHVQRHIAIWDQPGFEGHASAHIAIMLDGDKEASQGLYAVCIAGFGKEVDLMMSAAAYMRLIKSAS